MNAVKIFAVLAFVVFASTVGAAEGPKVAEACSENQLVIGSGTPAGTYGQMMPALAEKCNMACEVQQTQGGYDNLMKTVNEKFDGGIVQADLLEFLSRTEPDIKKKIRSLFSLHGSSLHIIIPVAGVKVTTEKVEKKYLGLSEKKVSSMELVPIKSIQDLKGKPIAAWSSAVVTSTIIDERMKLGLQIIEVKTRKEGLDMLRKGQVYAFMGMGGKPLDWVESEDPKKVDVTKDMTLLNMSATEISSLGEPYYPVKVTYRSIGANGVNTVTVRNDMVVRDIKTGALASAIPAFRQCFVRNLDAIKSMRGKHPSWSDVEASNSVSWIEYNLAIRPVASKKK